MHLRSLLCVALLLSPLGCALTNETLKLANSRPASLQGGDGRKIQIVMPFLDEREQPRRCGMKKNGYNMDTADLLCSEDPLHWFGRNLASQLRDAGFDVFERGEDASPTTFQVSGSVVIFFSEPIIHFASVGNEMDISARLTVRTANGLEATRSFYTKGDDSSVIAWTLSLAEKSYQEAADRIVREMVIAIVNPANRYPALGAGPGTPQLETAEAR